MMIDAVCDYGCEEEVTAESVEAFGVPMCEACTDETISDATCHECGHFPAAVQTARFTGNATFQCQNPGCMEVWQ